MPRGFQAMVDGPPDRPLISVPLRCRPGCHIVVSLAVEAPASDVLPNSAPLFEEKWDALFAARAKNLAYPLDFHRPRTPSGFAADNYPVNIDQIHSCERTDQWFARKKANGGRDSS